MRRLLLVFTLALLGLSAHEAPAQTQRITGRVTNAETQAPLSGVQVVVRGTTVGTLTDASGNYVLTNVPAGATTLAFSSVGFRTSEVAIQGTVVNVALQPQAVALEGIVVTALGVERERSQLGTAQQQIRTEDLNVTRAQSVVNQLQGKVSGVQITGSGTQGGSNNITIRGSSSIAGNNQPLFIVDGIPISNHNRGIGTNQGRGLLIEGWDYGNAIADLNPEDIETVTILKGPNAAAIYGSRASNGAVVITTKRGALAGGGMRTELTTSFTFERPSVLPNFQDTYGQGAAGGYSFTSDQSWGPRLEGQPICQFDSPRVNGACQPTPFVANPNNVRDFFETGRSSQTTLAVSGGTERANARLSVGYDNIDGYVPNNTFQKYSAMLNGAVQVTDALNATGTAQYIRNDARNRPGTGYLNSIMQQFFWFGRQVDINSLRDYHRGATANAGPLGREFNWNYNYHNNPYWLQFENPVEDSRDRVIVNGTVSYALAEGVTAMLRGGSDIFNFSAEQRYAQGNLNWTDPSFFGGFNFIDDYSNEHNSELLVTANRDLLPNLQVNALGGAGVRREFFRTQSQTTAGLTVPGIYNVSNAAITPTLNRQIIERHVNSAFGSLSFTWNRWLTLEGTARNDWSSTLPRGDNSYFYPSLNTSVVLTEALPALRNDVLTFAKIRGGIAEVGNDATPYQLRTTFQGQSQQFQGQAQYTLNDQLANAQLKPEITRSSEVGLEMEFFGGRAFVDASYYDQSTRNQIFNVPVSPASGFTSQWINAGLVNNRGVEALVGIVPVQLANGLRWTSTVNFGRNRSKIEELYPGVDNFLLGNGLWGGRLEARVGQPMGAIFGAVFARDEATGKLLTDGGIPFTEGPWQYLGSNQPDWTGGWNNEVAFGGVSVGMLFDVRRGGNILSYTNMVGDYSGVLANSLRGREAAWDSPGILVDGIDVETGEPNTIRVTAERYFQSASIGIAEPYVYDASFVKLREMRLAFDLPQRWTGRVGTNNISLAITGRNLLTWTDVPNIDPEFAYSSGNFQGVEYAIPANPRSVGVSVRIRP
jgi:TonB-linked SusC/RagA family outer membrane protein